MESPLSWEVTQNHSTSPMCYDEAWNTGCAMIGCSSTPTLIVAQPTITPTSLIHHPLTLTLTSSHHYSHTHLARGTK
jgi:hypothetical protein